MFSMEVSNISLSYNHHPVVRELSFDLQPAEIVGLIGPNGCGKTSVIKALSRILSLRSGQITLDGRDLARITHGELARLVGVVPQNPALPDTFTVTEVVLLGRNPHLGLLRGESARDMKIVWWAMERTGLSALAGRRIGELSGGEKQRVTIARILAQEPRVILLDEPTSSLDISHQIEILDLVKSLCRERELAVLLTLHDLNLAAQYCDRLIMLKNGQVHARGTPEEVITEENIRSVFNAESLVRPHPISRQPAILLVVNGSSAASGTVKNKEQFTWS
ncbi:MAG: heme ABC transporter ATP-binding protein [Dehalococcoidales bacterium]|nr:heme ABC transporter ATP-binding protein [Dehalococcoidales bacterium]